MGSITTIPSTEITSNDKKADIENLRPSSKTPFKSSEGQLVIEYMPSKTRPIANVELVSTDNIKTYTVQFFNADGTVTTRKVCITYSKLPSFNWSILIDSSLKRKCDCCLCGILNKFFFQCYVSNEYFSFGRLK